MDNDDRRMHVHLELHEGTVFYSDDQGHSQKRAMAFLSLAMLTDDKGEGQIAGRHIGTPGMVAELLARFFVTTPGMLEAVQGMIAQQIKMRLAQGGLG